MRRDRDAVAEPPVVGIDPDDFARLVRTFRAPRWFADLGRMSWLLVGVLLVVVGLVWLLGETAQIVNPLTAAAILAAVTSPLAGRLQPRVGRTAGAAIVLVAAALLAVAVVVAVVAGITSQSGEIAAEANAALTKVEGWLRDAGVGTSGAQSIGSELKSSVPAALSALVHGIFAGIAGIASLMFGLSLAALSFFFLLRDGPQIRRFVDRHLGVPPVVGTTITGNVLRSLRNYFRGVTIVALFNGTVVGLGALLLHVPLPGTIALVTFVTAYIPFIGAFAAGTFAVVLALGGSGLGVAVAMLVIVLLANGLLQNLVQPFAMGAALSLSPLVVLVVTIGAGCLFGTFGLILAAPLTSAAVHISSDLSLARVSADGRGAERPT
jgi:predicted PurR-regulated permease PerM